MSALGGSCLAEASCGVQGWLQERHVCWPSTFPPSRNVLVLVTRRPMHHPLHLDSPPLLSPFTICQHHHSPRHCPHCSLTFTHSSSNSPPHHPPRSSPCRRSILVDDLDMKRGHWDGISSEAKDFVATLLNKVGARVGGWGVHCSLCILMALHAVFFVSCCGAVGCWVAALLRPPVL